VSNSDLALIQYLQLAKISQAKRQQAGSDRFLILAGVAACRSGWLDVAEACRDRVLEHNPHHLLNRWPTLPDAVRSPDFSTFLRQLERLCPVERAETILAELKANIGLEDGVSPRDQAREQLADPVWDSPASLNEEPDPGEIEKTA
jgi:hypothetical protein